MDTHTHTHIWVSMIAQLVKNPLAMQETWVRSLGWEDPPEEGMATHSSILAWRIMDRGAWQITKTKYSSGMIKKETLPFASA